MMSIDPLFRVMKIGVYRKGMTMGSASSLVEKIGIYRKGNDIKMGVIPRHEESLEVLFMFKFIIS